MYSIQVIISIPSNFIKFIPRRGRVMGAHAQMKMFDHLFGIYLGTLVVKHSDNLSRTLQRYMSAQDGSAVSQLTLKTIEKMKNDETFLWFWRKCIQVWKMIFSYPPRSFFSNIF